MRATTGNHLKFQLRREWEDKAGNISSNDNYRPIALASMFSKFIKIIILDRIEKFMDTNPNQFGFKKKHRTDQCIYVLKEVIDLYRSLNGSVFVCFLDASRYLIE